MLEGLNFSLLLENSQLDNSSQMSFGKNYLLLSVKTSISDSMTTYPGPIG